MILGINLEFNKNYTLIRLKGDLLVNNLKMLEEVVHHQFMKRTKTIAIDFNGIYLIDPGVSKMMDQFKKYSDLHNIKIVFLSDKPHIEKMLRDVNLDSYFDIIAEENLEENSPKKKKIYTNKFNLQFDTKLFS